MKAFNQIVLGATASFILAVNLPAQIDIPIHLEEVDGALRVGIDVAFATDSGVTTPGRYLLDTGSEALIANQDRSVGASIATGNEGIAAFGITSTSIHPFRQFTGEIVLFDRQSNPVSIGNVGFGSAFDTSEHPSGGTVVPGFDGIIGAGLAPSPFDSSNGGNPFVLYSALGQIAVGQGLRPGFTIDLASRERSLQIGVTDEQIARFEAIAVMNEPRSDVPPEFRQFPSTGYPAYNQKLFNTTLLLNGDSLTNERIPVTIDTGAPDTNIVQGPADAIDPPSNVAPVDPSLTTTLHGDTVLIPGTNVEVRSFEEGDFIYDFLASGEFDPGLVVLSDSTDDGHLNTGIAPFLHHQITFLLDDGIVGFTPVPEPSTFALWIGVGVVGLLLGRHRR